MKKRLTELVFILDKSGSMAGLEKDTIGGYNSMLKKQKDLQGEAYITTVLFDNTYQLLHDRIDIRAVNPMSKRDYQVGGATALLDAIGKTISKIINVQKHTAKEFRAEKVLFVIITDGEENASREYSSRKIKAQIQQQKTTYGWEFIFLGANIDAVETAASFGIPSSCAQGFVPDAAGTALNFAAVGRVVSGFRERSAMPMNWKQEIEADYKKRAR